MLETKEQLQAQLDYHRQVRGELDLRLVDQRIELQSAMVNLHTLLRHESFSCDNWDVDDNSVDVLIGFYHNKLRNFRTTQGSVKSIDEAMQDEVRTLADDELWKEA